MEGKYEVTCHGRAVGTVEISREGLYYRILCRCEPVDGEIHRLYADSEKLGVLVPDRGEWLLQTKVAAKRLKEGCVFTLDGQCDHFIPICPEAAFEHLDKLREAKLAFRDGVPGLIIQI